MCLPELSTTWGCTADTSFYPFFLVPITESYSVLQPVTAALFTVLLLGVGMFPSCSSSSAIANAEEGSVEGIGACLDAPGWSSILGMVGVFTGLALVIMSEPTKLGADEIGGSSISGGRDKYRYELVGKGVELS